MPAPAKSCTVLIPAPALAVEIHVLSGHESAKRLILVIPTTSVTTTIILALVRLGNGDRR
jgi:hypothetical protein